MAANGDAGEGQVIFNDMDADVSDEDTEPIVTGAISGGDRRYDGSSSTGIYRSDGDRGAGIGGGGSGGRSGAPVRATQSSMSFKAFAGFNDDSNYCGATCGASVEEFSRTANMVVTRVNEYVKSYCKFTAQLESQLKSLVSQKASTTDPAQTINLNNNIAIKEMKISARKEICALLDRKWKEYNGMFADMLEKLKKHAKAKSKMSDSKQIEKAELPLKREMAALLSGLAHLTPRGDENEAYSVLSAHDPHRDMKNAWTAEQANAVRLNAINMAANCGAGTSGSSIGGSGCPIEGGPIEMDNCTFEAAVKTARRCKTSEDIPQVFKDFNTDEILKKHHTSFVAKLASYEIQTLPDILEYVACHAAAYPLLFPTFMAAGRHVFKYLPRIMENTCEACLDSSKFKHLYKSTKINQKINDANFREMFSTEHMHKYLDMVKEYLHQLKYRMGKKNLKVMQEDDLLWTLAPNKAADNCKNPYIRKLSVPSCEKDRIKNMLTKKAAEEACKASNQCASAVGVPAGLAALMPSVKKNSGAGTNSNACGIPKFTKRRLYHTEKLNSDCGFGGCVSGDCKQFKP